MFRRDGVAQLHLAELLGGRLHEPGGLLEVLDKRGELGIRSGQLARPYPLDQRACLVTQRQLDVGEHHGVLADFPALARLGFLRLLDQVPGRGDDFFLSPGDLVLLLLAPAHSAARGLRLRERAVERPRLNEKHVRLRGQLVITCDGVVRDEVPRHEVCNRKLAAGLDRRVGFCLVGFLRGHDDLRRVAHLFEEERVGRSCLLGPAALAEPDALHLAAVDRVVEVERRQAEIVLGLGLDDDFFDGRRLVVASGMSQLNGGLPVGYQRDEVVFADTDRLAVVDGGDVVTAVLDHLEATRAGEFVSGHRGGTPVVELNHAIGERLVGLDLDLDLGALHGVDVAAGIFDDVFHARPRRVVIGQLEVLDHRHRDDIDGKLVAADAPRRDVIAKWLAEGGEEELVAAALLLPPHGRLFPVEAIGVLGVERGGGGLEARDLRGDDQVGALTNRCVARADIDLIERRFVRLQPAGPQARRAVTPVAGPRRTQPDQGEERDERHRGVGADALPTDDVFDGRRFGDLQRIFGQQIKERIRLLTAGAQRFGLADKRFDAAVEGRDRPLDVLGCPLAVQPLQRPQQGRDDHGDDRAEQQQPAPDNAAVGEGELVGDVDADQRQQQGGGEDGAGAARGRARLQLALDAPEIVLQVPDGRQRGRIHLAIPRAGFLDASSLLQILPVQSRPTVAEEASKSPLEEVLRAFQYLAARLRRFVRRRSTPKH